MEELLREMIEVNDRHFKMHGRDMVLGWQNWWRKNRQRAIDTLANHKEDKAVAEPFRVHRDSTARPSSPDAKSAQSTGDSGGGCRGCGSK